MSASNKDDAIDAIVIDIGGKNSAEERATDYFDNSINVAVNQGETGANSPKRCSNCRIKKHVFNWMKGESR